VSPCPLDGEPVEGSVAATIVALRAEREAETRRADDNDDARKRAEAERDALAAVLARVTPVVEAALECCSPKSISVIGLARACDAYRATSNDTKGNA